MHRPDSPVYTRTRCDGRYGHHPFTNRMTRQLLFPNSREANKGARPTALRGAVLAHVTTVPMTLRFFQGQLRFMTEHGLRVVLISSPGRALDAIAATEGVERYEVPMSRGISVHRDVVSLVRLIVLFRRIRPTIVHAHTPKAGLLATIAARAVRVPVRIYHVHGLRLETATGMLRMLLLLMERTASASATHVQAVSPSVASLGSALGLGSHSGLEVLGAGSVNGIDLKAFSPAGAGSLVRQEIREALGIPLNAIVLGYVGRLVPDKGIRQLVEAWNGLRERFPSLWLLLVGDSEAHQPLAPDVLRSFEDPRVRVTGFVENVASYYDAMDIFVLPSYREGLPVTALEAAAMRLPIVLTDVTGSRDAVCPGVTGTLIPPRSAEAIETAVARYILEPGTARAHGQAARAWVATAFDPRQIWSSQLATYARLVADAMKRRAP